MAENLATLVARLTADASGFKVGLAEAERHLNSFSARSRTMQRNALAAFDGVAVGWRGLVATMGTLGLGVSLGSIISQASSFERQMNILRATSGATTIEINALQDVIERAGISFRVGARSAATAAQELQKAGVSIEALTEGALESAITLAQAVGGDFESSATIAASAMQVFQLSASDLDQVIQGVTGTVLGGRFELNDYALALQQGGGAAKAAGVSLDDFNAALLLIQRTIGSSGSDTGTALRTFLARLTPQSAEAGRAMRRLGLDFFTAEGRFIGLEEAAREIQRAFRGLTEEQRNLNWYEIFGVDAARVAQALYREGAEGLSHYRGEVQNAANAAEIAAGRIEGMAGAVALLRARWEEFAITLGEAGGGHIFTQGANAAAEALRAASIATRYAENPPQSDPATAAISDAMRRRNPLWGGLNQFGAQTSPQDVLAALRETETENTAWGRVYAELARRQQRAGNERWVWPDFRDNAEAEHAWDLMESLAPRKATGIPWSDWWTGFSMGLDQVHAQRGTFDPQALDGSRFLAGDPLTARDLLGADDANVFAELERELQQLAKAPGFELGEAKVDIEGLYSEMDRLKAISDDLARDVEDTLRDAFISADWDFASIGEQISRAWRAAIWDAFFGATMQRWMSSVAGGLARMLGGANGVGAAPGAGAVGILDGILGGPRSDIVKGAGKAGGSSGGGGLLGDIVGALFGGFFADGGYLRPGEWGIAGEHGPEPIYGGRAGMSVIPAAGAPVGAVIQVGPIHIDSRGGAVNEARIKIAVEEAAELGAQRGVQQMMRVQRRGSTL